MGVCLLTNMEHPGFQASVDVMIMNHIEGYIPQFRSFYTTCLPNDLLCCLVY